MGRPPLLTKENVLGAVQRWTAKNGRQPSVQELRHELGVASIRTLFRYLRMIESDGAIGRRPGIPGVKLLKPASEGIQTRAVAIIGRVPAGSPLLADENIEGWIQIPKRIAGNGSREVFLLTVQGTSMNRTNVDGETIDDGDLILVRRQPTARSGDIVVSMVDGDATVKRLVSARGYFILKPESSDKTHRQIIVERDFQIIGKVTHVFKKGSDLLRLTYESAPAH